MLARLKRNSRTAKERLVATTRGRIRDAAIKNARKRLALNGVNPRSLSEEELESFVAEEESKLIERLKKGSLLAALVVAGVQ